MFKTLVLIISSGIMLLFSGCYQVASNDDYRTVPVTNNPHYVPYAER